MGSADANGPPSARGGGDLPTIGSRWKLSSRCTAAAPPASSTARAHGDDPRAPRRLTSASSVAPPLNQSAGSFSSNQ